jgi:5-methylcytosine-specific restriction endonuclease McrA
MSLKEDLLRKLSVGKLKHLAEKNRVSLIGERTNWNSLSQEKYALTNKEDIIEVLSKSSKITEKKVREFTEPEKKPVRKSIPKSVKISVWNKYIGASKAEGRCYVCGRTIHITEFDCGHNKAVSKKGGDEIDNLRPICHTCNLSMGTESIESFKKTWHPEKTAVKKTVSKRRRAEGLNLLDPKVLSSIAVMAPPKLASLGTTKRKSRK